MKSSSGARNRMKRGRRRRKPGTLRAGAGIKKGNTRGTVEIRGAAGDKQRRSGKAAVGKVMRQEGEEQE